MKHHVKRAIGLLVFIILLCNLMTMGAWAAPMYSGYCGDNVTWSLYMNTLTIQGSSNQISKMNDFSPDTLPPWTNYKSQIEEVVFKGRITIGNYAFYDCDSLSSLSDSGGFGSSEIYVDSIGAYAFANCDELRYINLGTRVSMINEGAFSNCKNLAEVVISENCEMLGSKIFAGDTFLQKILFEGNSPTFSNDSFYGVSAEAVYDCKYSWTNANLQNYGGMIEWTAPHYEESDEAVEPTCTADGLTAGSHCSVCKTTLKEQKPVKAPGHTIVAEKAVEATCSKTGLTEGSYCYVCKQRLAEQTVVPKTEHTPGPKATETTPQICTVCNIVLAPAIEHSCSDSFQLIPAVMSNCTTPGNKGYFRCSCGKLYDYLAWTENNVLQEIIAQEVILPARGHSGQLKTARPASDKKSGEMTHYECIDCGKWFSDQECNDEIAKDANQIPMVKTVKLSQSVYTYSSKQFVSPKVIVIDDEGKVLIEGTDYLAARPKSAQKVGSYKVIVTGKGPYSFTKTLIFKINPVKTSISKVTGRSKSFTVKWAKKTGEITGYQVQYSTSKRFSSSKTITIKGPATVSKTIKKLKAAKTYYVRVRTYKTVSGTKFYSAWSSIKPVRIKK